jgi:HPt (histidine-containing phosphotransfer) domain-containing protein
VAELAGVFLEDARWGLQEVEEALQRGDAPAVERVAHKLKGGSGSVGARGCPASTRSWKTSAHQEISRKAPNYSDESGRSWGGSSGR